MILISACLIGINCRYDASNSMDTSIMKRIKEEVFIPVCPEQLGGLSTPRPSASIQNGTGADVVGSAAKVIDMNGRDVTREFLKGAQEALTIAKLLNIQEAILKENSPSCGVNFTSSNFRRIKGTGVFAAMLRKEGIKTCSV